MDNKNKGFPNGWGDNSDEDDDYGFIDDTDDDDEDSAWGNSSSPFKKNEPVSSSDTNSKTNSQSNSATSNANNNAGVASIHNASVQNIKQPESISSPAPTLNSSPNQGYVIQKQKKSPVLIIVIIALVLVVGILASVLFTMSRNKKSDTSSEKSSDSDSVETTAESTDAPTESEIKSTTAVATTPVELTTQTTNSIPDQYTSDEISAMFSAYIAENPDPNRTYDNTDYGYALIDLNSDGTQELLITEGEKEKGSPWIIGVYAIKNSKLILLMGFNSRFPGSLYGDNIISYYSSLGQGGGTAFYKYTSGDSFDMVDIISYDYSSGTKVMYHNGNVITEAESYSILANYNPIQFEPKSLKINIQPTTSVPTETYAFYGIVSTESDSLNLREKPSTDSKVITELPKGTKASVYYVERYSDWYKIYTDNGYEGYVSAQYMKEYNETSNNNDTPYVSGTQTPWGTFTYSNYDESEYDRYTIYEPTTVGVYLNFDIEAFNEKHSNYRLDKVYFWVVKDSLTEDKPHDYKMYLTFTGTVLSDSINKFEPTFHLKNEKTGSDEYVSILGFKTTLYKGETFCYDMISYGGSGKYICDNATYTLY